MIGTMDVLIGFIVLLIVIVIETVFLSKRLANTWIKSRIFYTTLLSNLLSTFFGLLGLLSWLWGYIVDGIKDIFVLPEDFTSKYFGIGFVFLAFILTLLFEIPLNLLFLRRDFKKQSIIVSSIYANMLTYVLLGILALSTN